MDEDNNHENLLYRCLINIPFIDPDYIIKMFKYIKEKNKNDNIDKLFKYFEHSNIRNLNISEWNYFNNSEHTTNNCYESYNNKINNYFNKNHNFSYYHIFSGMKKMQ